MSLLQRKRPTTNRLVSSRIPLMTTMIICSILCVSFVIRQYNTSLSITTNLADGLSYNDLQTLVIPQEISTLLSSTPNYSRIRVTQPVPDNSRKLFWIRKKITHKLYEPVIRSFHSRGYSLTEDYKRAHILWTDHPYTPLYKTLEPWQRYAWLPNAARWDDKDSMAYYMNQYYASKGNILQSFPESYVLHSPDDFQRFVKRLRDGGIDEPWVLKQPTVNQGKGIEIVGPNSPRLQEILKEGRPFNDGRLVAQKYICDELTYSGRKFDFRIFWMVASVDPLIVLYQTQHNYVRIGHANYDETDFSNTKSHLTTHTFGANEGKATWDEFRVYIEEFHSLQGYRLSHIKDPFLHLENQVKTVISNLVDAFKNITFHRRGITAQNAFSWHAADMIMDNDLDVYIIEATDGPGKDEDYDFRIVMHNTIFGDMIDIVEEISRRQEKRIPLDIHQMENDGVFGSYEVVYNDGWMFEYDFDRLPKQGCSISKAAKAGSRQVVVPKDISEKTRIKADLTALPKLPADVPFKTFFLQGRTGQSGEPIARSLRSKGWIPVDDRNSAQLIFEKLRTPTFPQTLHPWQFYNQFPDESDFFGLSNRGRKICNPLLYNGRQFRVKVYWLVLSIDPLIVFYHDGYMDIPHSEQDLYEFLPQNSSESPVWRGSWMGLEYHINATISSISQENSTAHVKNQMKSSLVGVAENFESYIQEKLGGAKIPLPKSFGIYTASFEIDRDLNTLLVDVSVLDIPSEGYQYIVDMHDDLFGSAFNILEKLNGTSSSSDFSIQQLKSAVDPSRYELLVNRAENERWNFEYPGGFKAAICS